jgi:hypothetical protein
MSQSFQIFPDKTGITTRVRFENNPTEIWPARCLTGRMMSSYESIYKKMASSVEAGGAENQPAPEPQFDPARHVAPLVAHELNNILTIVQGYADRLLIRHGEDQTLVPHLKLISEAAKRAAVVVRNATPPGAAQMLRKTSPPKTTA